jgi:hypothetical protein
VAAFHSEEDEPASPAPIRISIDDNTKYTAADYRERLYKEMAAMKKGKGKKEGEGEAPPAAAAAPPK